MVTFVNPMAGEKITQETRQTFSNENTALLDSKTSCPTATISSIHLAQNFLHFPLWLVEGKKTPIPNVNAKNPSPLFTSIHTD